MQDLSIFDIVVIAITLLFGIKGLFKGFIKEAFGLIGIVGGIFIASRLADTVGEAIAPMLALKNESSIELMGFIVGLLAFWVIAYILGMIISKIFSMSGLGVVDKLLGFLFGAGKIFLIFSILIYLVCQIQTIKEKLDASIGHTITYPILVAGGTFIVKLDKQTMPKEIQTTVDKAVEKTKETVKDISVEETKKTLEKMKDEAVKKTNETIDAGKKALENK
ncbi:MAG: CvpA family protein [Candidatus Marinarcus sp.]|uniref:CvpA family protein n=1 Tax=Candidatus Marinarcus sp. TaxID=3100987 RepID=UPI003B0016BF